MNARQKDKQLKKIAAIKDRSGREWAGTPYNTAPDGKEQP